MANITFNEDGTLPVMAWPGLYPLYYVDKEYNILCPECANEGLAESWPIACDINYEDSFMTCECGKTIESAYGE